MRLRALPLALLSLILPAVSADQANWSSHSSLHGPEPAPAPQSTTLVDALSADPDYTSLLHLLQRARLIPTLNKLNGSTFFAPTNDAIDRRSAKDSLWHSLLHDDSFVLTDNVQEQLRQQLFYHLLNYSVPNVPTEPADPQVHKTLHFPRTPVEPPSKEPPPSPPWMPIPGGTLGGEPQRLRVGARSQGVWVGVDSFGEGGSEIVKGKEDAGNGVLLGIADVLDPPPSLSKIVSREASVSYFHKILTPTIRKLLNETPELTLFLPVDKAWKALDPYERLYLESEYASDDLVRILDMHAVVEKRVRYAESFQPALNLTTLGGTRLEIVVTPEETKVADAKLIKPDIYASNGVLHLVDSLLMPPDALQLTPEKYLLALNCTQFVSLLHSVDLKSLINDTETKYTILAPRDDVLSIFGDGEIPEKGSPELKKLLKYHFIPGKWSPSKLDDGLLLETSLEENGLDGDKQVLAVEVGATDKKSGEKSLRFGGAGVIGDLVEANNMLIYFVSRPLIPPSDSLQTALPFLDLSIFLAAVFSTSQAETLRTTPRTSLLMPQNLAFKRLGMLVSAHLLSASSKQDLENVILHHTLDTVEYAHSLQNGSQHTFATLEGSDIKVERTKNGTAYISSSGGWAGMKAELYPKDLLTQTGVIHELSDVLIPRSVQLSIGKLVKAAKGSTMATLVNKAGFDWILNGTAPPEDSEWADAKLGSVGWTLLCPPDDAFKEYNLTQLYADEVGLQVIVTQHLIPSPPRDADLDAETNALNNNQPLALDDSVTYSTLRSSSSAYGDIVFQQRTEDMQYVVGIKGARGTNGQADWARVLSWGRSTTGGGTGGVIQIDRLLVPYQPPWWIEYGAPSAVGAIGVVLICAFFYGVRLVWRRDTTEATYEPVGGFGRDDDSE